MIKKTDQEADVKIYAPDTSLQKKIGVRPDRLFTSQAVSAAQKVIAKLADEFLEESVARLDDLVALNKQMQTTPESALRLMPSMVDAAFSIKAQAGQAGYDLAATLAKSLQLHCEQIKNQLSSKDLSLIQWHVVSIGQLLRQKIKGDGGKIGQVILEELKRLHATPLT